MATPVAIPRPYVGSSRTSHTQDYYNSHQDRYHLGSNQSSPEYEMNRTYNYTHSPELHQPYPSETRHRGYSQKVQESPPEISLPSPKIKRGRANSMGGSFVEANDYLTSRASKYASASSVPSEPSDDKAFKQILSAIARVQTNLSQQCFSIMELTEKQNAMQRRFEQSYGRIDEGVNRIVNRTESLSDDVKDMREQMETDYYSTINDEKVVREITQKHKEDVSRILQEINVVGIDVKEVKAGSFADRRGLTEPKTEHETDGINISTSMLQEIKDTIADEVKATVKSHVRAEIEGIRLELMTELKQLRQIVDETTNKPSKSKPEPDFSPQELLKFGDSDVTKYLTLYGFDKDWTSELNALQRKALLGCYVGKSHRKILKDQVKTMSSPGISFLSEKSIKSTSTNKTSK